MKKYLVTGGLGFLGAGLVKALVASGHAVRVLDNGSRGSAVRLGEVADDVEIVEGDIRDADLVKRAINGVDAVCHLAYVNGTRFFYERPAYVLDVGVKGMVNVLDGCMAANVGELLMVSSSEVYQSPSVVPTDESVPLIVPDPHNPRYSYGGGKIISELMTLHYGQTHFDRVTVVRPHNVYGANMGWEHVVPEFVLRMKDLCEQAKEHHVRFPIQGTGQETRAFVYIDDFIQGLLCVLHKGEHLNIYHVGTDEEITIEAVAREVGRYFGREVDVVPGKLQPGSTQRRCPDISKVRGLGFEPQIPFSQGLLSTAQWYSENAHLCPSKE